MKILGRGILGALVVVFASCTAGEDGVFASVEREVKVNENNLADEANGTGIARYTVSASEDYYVAAIGVGKLFYRTVSGSAWSSMARPGEVQSVATVDSSAVYVVTDRGLYETSGLAPGATVWGSPIYSSDGTGQEITGMVALDGNLFLSTTDTDGTSRLIVNPQGSTATFTGTDNFAGIEHAASFDNKIFFVDQNSGFYRIDGTALGSDGTITKITASTDTTFYPQDSTQGWQATEINGVTSVTEGTDWLLVSSIEGYIYGYDGSGWVRSNNISEVLTGMIPVDTSSSLALVGTTSSAISSESANGYFEVTVDNGERTVAISSPGVRNYGAIVLENAGIRGFVADGGSSRIFALTVGYGIWHITNYGNDSEWQWE